MSWIDVKTMQLGVEIPKNPSQEPSYEQTRVNNSIIVGASRFMPNIHIHKNELMKWWSQITLEEASHWRTHLLNSLVIMLLGRLSHLEKAAV